MGYMNPKSHPSHIRGVSAVTSMHAWTAGIRRSSKKAPTRILSGHGVQGLGFRRFRFRMLVLELVFLQGWLSARCRFNETWVLAV